MRRLDIIFALVVLVAIGSIFYMILWAVRAEPVQAPSLPPHGASAAVSAPPPVASASAAPKLVQRLLGSFGTLFKTAEKDDRVHNITLGAEKLDGCVLEPKAIWSFNGIVGPRTKETGFKEAPVLIMGEVFQDVGGGMCQVSSTLHAAAIKTGLDIVKRYSHSRPSSYIPRGFDATVNYPKECWGGKQDPNICFDLQLMNPYDFPLTIRTRTEAWDADEKLPKDLRPEGPHRRLVVELWGIGPAAKVETQWKLYGTPDYKRRWRKGWKPGTWAKKKQSGRPGVRGVLVIDTTWPDGRKTHSFTVSDYKPVDEVWWVGRDWEGGDPW